MIISPGIPSAAEFLDFYNLGKERIFYNDADYQVIEDINYSISERKMPGCISYNNYHPLIKNRPKPDDEYMERVACHKVFQWMEANPSIQEGIKKRLNKKFPLGFFSSYRRDNKVALYVAISLCLHFYERDVESLTADSQKFTTKDREHAIQLARELYDIIKGKLPYRGYRSPLNPHESHEADLLRIINELESGETLYVKKYRKDLPTELLIKRLWFTLYVDELVGEQKHGEATGEHNISEITSFINSVLGSDDSKSSQYVKDAVKQLTKFIRPTAHN